MRKLRPAEERLLKAIPEDLYLEDKTKPVIRGHIRPISIKSTKKQQVNIATIRNLYKMGLIEHAGINLYSCPIRLTHKGRDLLGLPDIRDPKPDRDYYHEQTKFAN